MIYFTDIIRASSSIEELIYSTAAAASTSLQPRSHKGIPDGSMGQNFIYFFSPTHNLAQWHICHSLKPHKDEGSNSLILENYYKNKEVNGLSLFQPTYGLWPCPSQQLGNWLDKSFIQGAKGQFSEKAIRDPTGGKLVSLQLIARCIIIPEDSLILTESQQKGEKLHLWLMIMNYSASSDAWKPKKQQIAFVLDMYWESAVFQ